MHNPKLLNKNLAKLCDTVAKLRDPESGCPWDKEQTFKSLAPFVIEEAYEVLEAILNENWSELEKELGDLLLQIIFHTQIASELKLFNMGSLIDKINQKMIDRHPHVFDRKVPQRTVEEQRLEWENIKYKERQKSDKKKTFDDIPNSLPALKRSIKIQQRASKKGFDWKDMDKIFLKLSEEVDELKQAKTTNETTEELGDILFTVVNLARHLNIDPEEALYKSNAKFVERFEAIEIIAESDKTELETLSEVKKNNLWRKVKKAKQSL